MTLEGSVRRGARPRRLPCPELAGRNGALEAILPRLVPRAGTTARVVLLSGSAASGRSRMLDEIAQRASERFLIVRLRGRPDASRQPLSTLSEGLVQVFEDHPSLMEEVVSQLTTDQGELLARFLPDVAAQDGPGRSVGLFSLDEPIQLFIAVLQALGGERIPLLLVDDLFDVDPATLRVLQGLTEVWEGIPVPVCATTLPLAEVDNANPALDLLFMGPWRNAVHEHPLEPLTLDGVRDMLEMVQPGLFADVRLVGLATSQCGSLPGHIEELLYYIMSRGALSPNGVDWAAVGDVPEKPGSLSISRLEALSSSAAQTVAVASVLGTTFTVAELRPLPHISGLARADLVKALNEGTQAGLLRIREDEFGRYFFQTRAVRDALYQQLPADVRRESHKLIAQNLERDNPRRVEMIAARLMNHYGLAGDPQKAVDLAQKLGELYSRWFPRVGAALARTRFLLVRGTNYLAPLMVPEGEDSWGNESAPPPPPPPPPPPLEPEAEPEPAYVESPPIYPEYAPEPEPEPVVQPVMEPVYEPMAREYDSIDSATLASARRHSLVVASQVATHTIRVDELLSGLPHGAVVDAHTLLMRLLGLTDEPERVEGVRLLHKQLDTLLGLLSRLPSSSELGEQLAAAGLEADVVSKIKSLLELRIKVHIERHGKVPDFILEASRHPDVIARDLESPNQERVEAAIREFVAMGEACHDTLIRFLRHTENERARGTAVRTLIYVQPKGGVQGLLGAITSGQNAAERARLIRALEWVVEDEERIITTLDGFVQWPEREVRQAALQILVKKKSASLLHVNLVKALEDREDEIKEDAIVAMGDLGLRQSVPYLVNIIKRGSPKAERAPFLQVAACQALGKIQEPAGVPHLVSAMQKAPFGFTTKDKEVRIAAAMALAQFPASATGRHLRESMESDDPVQRTLAFDALELQKRREGHELTREAAVPPPSASDLRRIREG